MWWLEVGFTNALLATVLAALAAVIARRWTSPALAHFLWLLVLARLLAPPLIGVPIAWRPDPSPASIALPAIDELAVPAPVIDEGNVADKSQAAPAKVDASPGIVWSWPWAVGGAWLAGSFVFLGLLGRDIWWFRRLLALAQPADERLQRRAESLANIFGLRRPPTTLVVPGRFPPTLWGFGRRATVLLPTEFLERLEVQEIDTVLAHELAHLKRGDRWVRLLEIAALTIYWWHPVAWLAVRRLRAAEELCCDGWVAHLLPAQAKSYARSLLTAVEFLAPPSSRVPLPGVGMSAKSLVLVQRRITMILARSSAFRLGNKARAAALCLAAVLLPLTFSGAATTDGKVDPAQKAALVEAAMKTYRATQTAYDVGTAEIGQVQVWSRRWMDAESLGATAEEQRQAIKRHLDRMKQLLDRVAVLYGMGLKGGESEKLHACEYFVAEAEILLSQAK